VNEVILKPKDLPEVGMIAENIKPDTFAGKSIGEIASIEIFAGNQPSKIGDFFEISGKSASEAKDTRIIIKGDITKVKMVGKGMRAGEIVIGGDVGMYVGLEMRGGKITVEGNTDSFAGQKMRGGELLINGNTGDYLGASYRGDWRGMKGGTIIVEGNAGTETGLFMVGGKIIIKGDCGTFAGVHMKKGTIIIEGSTPARAGGEMLGGSIVVKGETEVLPSFKRENTEKNLEIDGEKLKGTYQSYSGDHAERNAKGALYVRQ
jgi:formylmethanofuran dehydrogenase subunit C